MTRKDFQLIADAVKSTIAELDGQEYDGHKYTLATLDMFATRRVGIHNTAEALADALATTNPNFNRARFLTACGVN